MCNTKWDGASQCSGIKAGYRSTESQNAQEEVQGARSAHIKSNHNHRKLQQWSRIKFLKRKRTPEPTLVMQTTYPCMRSNVVASYSPVAYFVYEQRDIVWNHFAVMVSWRIPVYSHIIKWIVIFWCYRNSSSDISDHSVFYWRRWRFT